MLVCNLSVSTFGQQDHESRASLGLHSFRLNYIGDCVFKPKWGGVEGPGSIQFHPPYPTLPWAVAGSLRLKGRTLQVDTGRCFS